MTWKWFLVCLALYLHGMDEGTGSSGRCNFSTWWWMDEDWNLATSFWAERCFFFFPPLYHAAQNHILSSHTYFLLLLLLLPNQKQCNMIINLRGMDCITSELCYFICILICISPLISRTIGFFTKQKKIKRFPPILPSLHISQGKEVH